MNRKVGTRVYLLSVDSETHEKTLRRGRLDKDERLSDYSDVRFDDAPGSVQPVPSHFLFTEGDDKEVGL